MRIVTRNTECDAWTPAAARSVLERGTLPEWRELYKAAQEDLSVFEMLEGQVNTPISLEHPEECDPYPLAKHLLDVIRKSRKFVSRERDK